MSQEGEWHLSKSLGNGHYGSVTLWEKQGELLALKVCRRDKCTQKKQQERWRDEIEFLQVCEHRGIVKGCKVPPELLHYGDSDLKLPALAMEYCERGSLRKELSLLHNKCGLSEFDVRAIARDIGEAIKYLHSQKIIHRDLKPENIVSTVFDGQIIYKLIDLGLAKRLDANSLCESEVGTEKYLAPEVCHDKYYSYQCDIWSLGVILFEVITGIRPFLDDSSTFQRYNIVKEKGCDDIYIYKNKSEQVIRSKHLPRHHHLAGPSASAFEQCLREMLQFDPKRRAAFMTQRSGGQDAEHADNFQSLAAVLRMKLLRVVPLSGGSELTFCIPPEGNPQFSALVARNSDCAIAELTVLHSDGSSKNLADCTDPMALINEAVRRGEVMRKKLSVDERRRLQQEHSCVYVFKKETVDFMSIDVPLQYPVPSNTDVSDCIILAQVWFHCRELDHKYRRLWYGQNALRLNLLQSQNQIRSLHEQVATEISNLRATLRCFYTSSAFDCEKCSELCPEASDDLLASRTKMHETLSNEECKVCKQIPLDASLFKQNKFDESNLKMDQSWQDVCLTVQRLCNNANHTDMGIEHITNIQSRCINESNKLEDKLSHILRLMLRHRVNLQEHSSCHKDKQKKIAELRRIISTETIWWQNAVWAIIKRPRQAGCHCWAVVVPTAVQAGPVRTAVVYPDNSQPQLQAGPVRTASVYPGDSQPQPQLQAGYVRTASVYPGDSETQLQAGSVRTAYVYPGDSQTPLQAGYVRTASVYPGDSETPLQAGPVQTASVYPDDSQKELLSSLSMLEGCQEMSAARTIGHLKSLDRIKTAFWQPEIVSEENHIDSTDWSFLET